ncbi:helicase associated domain-containing protein [Streptomyces halstedii]|uniref:helicase associated domain-containing protein n=1 Tax=Streptomyces halstedii TaxID=1944 RepID=UPI0033563455
MDYASRKADDQHLEDGISTRVVNELGRKSISDTMLVGLATPTRKPCRTDCAHDVLPGASAAATLGWWIADVRRYYAAGTLEAGRVTELETLGMVWSAWDNAWADGLAQDYAAVHEHLVPPTNAVWGGDGMALGVWLKNQRAAARKTRENAERRAAGEADVSAAGELSESRMEALDAIDLAWCPG